MFLTSDTRGGGFIFNIDEVTVELSQANIIYVMFIYNTNFNYLTASHSMCNMHIILTHSLSVIALSWSRPWWIPGTLGVSRGHTLAHTYWHIFGK